MHPRRASRLFVILPALLAASCVVLRAEVSLISVAPPRPAMPGDERFRTGPVQFAVTTPLAEIPVYQMDPASLVPAAATAGLEAEITRLHSHAKTLDSGPIRRAFETRIYLFENRLRPLATQFDPTVWQSLRSDLKTEWSGILAGLPAEKSATVATPASSGAE